MGNYDQQQLQTNVKRVKQTKKIVQKIVDQYFYSLQQELDKVYKNQGMIHIKEQLMNNLFQIKKTIGKNRPNEISQIREEMSKLKNEITLNSQIVPRFETKINTRQLANVKNELRNLIHLNSIENYEILPSSINLLKYSNKKPAMVIRKNGVNPIIKQNDKVTYS